MRGSREGRKSCAVKELCERVHVAGRRRMDKVLVGKVGSVLMDIGLSVQLGPYVSNFFFFFMVIYKCVKCLGNTLQMPRHLIQPCIYLKCISKPCMRMSSGFSCDAASTTRGVCCRPPSLHVVIASLRLGMRHTHYRWINGALISIVISPQRGCRQ